MILELKNATLAIDGKTLFYRLTQMVGSAEMLCIMGETGCGKLRCCAVYWVFNHWTRGISVGAERK